MGIQNQSVKPLDPYAGRWVARLKGQIIGQGGTPEQALEAARASRPKEQPEIIYVPTTHPLSFSKLLEFIQPFLPDTLKIYLVGGAVRDAILGISTHDLDFVVVGDAQRFARSVADALGVSFFPLDAEHGGGRVLLKKPDGNHDILDFTPMQGESLETDLRKRDFTINAIAVEAHPPYTLFDPLGGGADLHAKRIKACAPTAMKDDPIRVMRAIRQAAALNFLITSETRGWMREAVPFLQETSAERRRDELLRILSGPRPATALRAMDIMGVFPYILPELLALKGVSQSPPHIYDVWQHTLQTLSRLEGLLDALGTRDYDPERTTNLVDGLAVMRLGRYRDKFETHLNTCIIPDRPWRGMLFLAALYHDIGKPATRSVEDDGRIRFITHEDIGNKMLSKRANALRFSNQETQRLRTIVRHHMRPHSLIQTGAPPTRRAVFRFFRDTQDAGVDICLLVMADVLATYGPELPQDTWANYLDLLRSLLENYWEKPEHSISPPKFITGRDLIDHFDLVPGPLIGELLGLVQEAQAIGDIEDRSGALSFIERQLSANAK